MGGVVRCVGCGEVQWNLLRKTDGANKCRVCGHELHKEQPHPGRRFVRAHRDEPRSAATPT